MMEFQQQKAIKVSSEQHQLMRFCFQVNKALPFDGNAIEIFSDGYAMLQALMKAIVGAKHHIHMQFYIFENDMMGGPFVSHARVDRPNGRVVVVEAFVYAPEKKKRDLMRQLEASLYTLNLPQEQQIDEIVIGVGGLEEEKPAEADKQ